MRILTSINPSIDKIHKYYGTGTMEEAMNSIYAEIVHFDFINWLPILEVCVMQNYLPGNILDIAMNYFLWKGDIKKSADLARVLRFWRNKGLNDEGTRRKLLTLRELINEFNLIEESDKMRKVFTQPVDKEVFNFNSSYLYAGLKSLYYSGYLNNIMLLRIFYSYNLLYYRQLWEFGIRKLRNFTPYNTGIHQEWINVYFSTIGSNCKDDDLFKHILPLNPSLVERKRDLFLVIGIDKIKGSFRRMILFKQRGDNKLPMPVWRNEMLVN